MFERDEDFSAGTRSATAMRARVPDSPNVLAFDVDIDLCRKIARRNGHRRASPLESTGQIGSASVPTVQLVRLQRHLTPISRIEPGPPLSVIRSIGWMIPWSRYWHSKEFVKSPFESLPRSLTSGLSSRYRSVTELRASHFPYGHIRRRGRPRRWHLHGSLTNTRSPNLGLEEFRKLGSSTEGDLSSELSRDGLHSCASRLAPWSRLRMVSLGHLH